MSARFTFSCYCCCCSSFFFVVSLFHLCLSNISFDDGILCMGSEREALVEFKHGLIDEAGRLASWDDGKERDCCKWVGIGCDNITGHVHRIHLPAINNIFQYHPDYITRREFEEASKERLRGMVSSSLLHLKQLRHLDLSCNDFGGIQVPKFIGSLSNLRYLNLSRSNFSGMIPPQLGNLSELHVLCLGSFHMSWEGTSMMMNMQWLSSLHLLQHLDLSGLDLSQSNNWFQVINNIPSLVQLYLSNCQLSHTYTPHVASVNLTSLSLLDLSRIYFDSSLPQWIFNVTSLVTLDLSWCRFLNLIPDNIDFRNLTSLESLHVPGNYFMNSSSLFKGLSNTIGGNLISLDISFCGISSSVLESLDNLTSLLSLDLSGNQLTKTLPKLMGYNSCNLRDLDLSGNNFGNISLTILVESVFKCKSPHLESLRLSFSRLSGTIPDSIGRLSFLRSLSLDINQIYGPIPSSIGRLSSLKYLVLSNNQLNGGIPESIGELSLLKGLFLSDNKLNDCLPESIGGLSSLEVLYLHDNKLNGSLPYSIGGLSSLEELDLSDNQFNGNIPDSIGGLSSLEMLDLSNNQLTGVLTEAHLSKLVNLKRLYGEGNKVILRPRLANWIPPFKLQSLYLNSWVLGPQFPLWLQSQRDLEYLDISNTKISSPMPPGSFWRSLTNLQSLNISKNYMQGKLNPISSYSFQSDLDLSNNLFVGSLHDFLCSNGVKDTQGLNLGNNHFSGDIPECWEKWPNLFSLNLENNNFSGGIPSHLGFLSRLGSLYMRGNKLSGRLPASLMNLTNLQILQIGRNELVGNIPSWLGTELYRLRLLNLRSNNFYGNIPLELCHLKHIQILDLSGNILNGNIPRCFNNFSVLTGNEIIRSNEIVIYGMGFKAMGSDSLVMKGREDTYSSFLGLVTLLDLSCNNLVGNIPSELTTLLVLTTLNLSRNRLTGSIPEKIGDMKSLETFDLSQNMLSGELPVSLSQLNFLNNFNVSSNNLTGRVPSSTQLQSFNESCFFGNKLCGPPLTKSCLTNEIPTKIDSNQQEEDGTNLCLIISIVLGFVCGFWIVLGPLIVSRSWRITYFGFLNKLRYMVYDSMHKYCFNMFSK